MIRNYDCAGNTIYVTDEVGCSKTPFDQAIYFDQPDVNTPTLDVTIYNTDGSQAGNCLNGMRALTHLAFEELGIGKDNQIKLVQNGILLAVGFVDEYGTGVKVKFPEYTRGNGDEPDTVNLGNSHEVHWLTNNNDTLNIPDNYKPAINEEYILAIDGNKLTVRVFERGVGETGSCGTGAVAVLYSAYQRFGMKNVLISYPGGTLEGSIKDDGITLRGPIQQQ